MATLNLNKKKFIDENALAQIVKYGIHFGEQLKELESKSISPYDETHAYSINEVCIYNNYIYVCKGATTGTFNTDRWTLLGDDITELTVDEIKSFIGLTQEEITTLSSIIKDSSVELSKTWSSSKIYTDIQEAINECKQYCVAELAKKSTGNFKKVDDISEVTDSNYLYLIMNSSTNKYDIYALVDTNVELLTSTDINLSDYYTKSEIDNDFLKKTDATSTYATITNVNEKIDKTSITTTIDSTVTNEQVVGAKAFYDKISEVEETANTTILSTTEPIDKTVGIMWLV